MLQVPVTMRQNATGRFVARPAPVPDEAEGDTPEEALAKLQAGTTGGQTITLPITAPGQNPWLAVIGMWKDTDPELIAGWRQAIEDNRNAQEEEDRLREEAES